MLNKILAEDIEQICEYTEIEWDKYRDCGIFVTGATGLIGSLIIKSFCMANKKYSLNAKIYGLVRDLDKANEVFREFEGIEFVEGDVCKLIEVEGRIDYIFHCASVTTSKTMVSNPVETIEVSLIGTNNLLKFAKEKELATFVYISSMEMYGTFSDASKAIDENDLGYINNLAIRSNYPESKRMCENMCEAYLVEYDVPVKIARLAQTFGAGILANENRVFAQFARSAIKKNDIVLHTYGKSEGNYCYTVDCIRALIMLATKGQNGEAYNVSNPQTHTTICEMAKMVAEEFGEGKVNVVFEIDNTKGYAADTKMVLSSEKLQILGWKPEYNLKEAYERLIEYMKYEL